MLLGAKLGGPRNRLGSVHVPRGATKLMWWRAHTHARCIVRIAHLTMRGSGIRSVTRMTHSHRRGSGSLASRNAVRRPASA